MTQPAVVFRGLVKTYGGRRAVDDLSFEVGQGEIFALLGPNGAGKTTTVEIAEGYRRPTAGHVKVLGLDPAVDGARLKPRIGAMVQEGSLYPAITSREALQLFARFYPSSRSTDELLNLVGLQDSAGVRYRRLSGGQKQRLALALALVGRPELVFLDEPTAGMDPQARRATWDVVRNLRDEKVTVLLTTHYLDEAERLADRVAIIDRGKLAAIGSPAELVQRGASTVRVRTAVPINRNLLTALPSALSVVSEDATYILQTEKPQELVFEIVACLRGSSIPVLEIRVGQGSLEEVFLQITEQPATASEDN